MRPRFSLIVELPFCVSSPLLASLLFIGISSCEAKEPDVGEIIKLYERRLEHSRNLYLVCERDLDVLIEENGKPDKTETLPKQRFEYWQFNDSNRQDTTTIKSDGSKRDSAASFDAIVGEGVSLSKFGTRSFGYIAPERDPLFSTNRYRFWLNVRDWGHGSSEYIFNYILDHQASIELGSDPNHPTFVLLTTDYQPHWSDVSGGNRKHWLDPAKGYLPVRGEFHWQGDGTSRTERFEVLQSKLVGDVWMPVKLSEHTTGSYPDGQIVHNYLTTTVLDIEQGTVTEGALKLKFPHGTEFVDAVRGVAYTADEDGNPIGPVEPVMGSNAVGAPPADEDGNPIGPVEPVMGSNAVVAPSSGSFMTWFVGFILVLFLLLILGLWARYPIRL